MLLDEVGDIPPDLQVKLLRAIEHREVTPVGDARPRPTDIRVIAATNRPLAELMATGQFREDLFFRLSVFQIHIPPLRDRRDDIPALAEHFLRQSRLRGRRRHPPLGGRPRRAPLAPLGGEHPRAAQRHRARGHRRPRPHDPPGASPRRHRPSRPVAPASAGRAPEAARRVGPARGPRTSQPDPATATLYERFLELAEPPVLRAVLEQCRQNRAAAAQMLGIHRATLRQKLRKYGIE